MRERRKGARYSANFRVYFPEFDILGHTFNISLDGCYIIVDFPMSVGFITDFLIELPVVGVIALKGYVQHMGQARSGVGLEFVQVRFEPDQTEYYSLYCQFFKSMSQFENIRDQYLDLVQQDRLRLYTLPSKSREAETT